MPAVRQDLVSPQAGDAEGLSHLQDHVLEHAEEKGKNNNAMKSFRTSTTIAILTALVALALPMMAQQNNQIRIGINSTTEDLVGKSFVYALQERLNRSSVFRYDNTSDNRFELEIVSVSTDLTYNPSNNQGAAIGVVLTLKSKGAGDWFVDHFVVSVPQQSADEMAGKVLVMVNDDMNQLGKVLDNLPKKSPASDKVGHAVVSPGAQQSL